MLMTGCKLFREERPPTTVTIRTPPPVQSPNIRRFSATAYALEGLTKHGTPACKGIVAADPNVLPIGTRIRVHGAGPYSGEYLVRDTGKTIRGNEIDIYMDDPAEAIRFGRKPVRVEVLKLGE